MDKISLNVKEISFFFKNLGFKLFRKKKKINFFFAFPPPGKLFSNKIRQH
jgi:hypothetical protein